MPSPSFPFVIVRIFLTHNVDKLINYVYYIYREQLGGDVIWLTKQKT